MASETPDETRTESDSLGEIEVPGDAYWGAQTQRAVQNFPISDRTFGRQFIRALGLVKQAAAIANRELGTRPAAVMTPVIEAAQEVAAGDHDDQFPVDIFQTGSGTSTNMNANEVIANRATELAADDVSVHPNDDVNFGQSSNDVIPTAMHVAVVETIETALVPALETLRTELDAAADRFDGIVKTGRTHLQDATPVRLDQEFGGYRTQIDKGLDRLAAVRPRLQELALGGTATGTGLNTHEAFPQRAITELRELTGLSFREADDHFEAQAAHDAISELHGVLRTIAGSMNKMANDLRLLASGPRNGLGELDQPENQPGSSIMPGKINPVVAEAVTQVHKQVVGNDAAVTAAGGRGELELHLYKPLLADRTLQSIRLLANSATAFAEKFVGQLAANEAVCQTGADRAMALATALNPIVGYDRASELAKRALQEGKTIREIALEADVLTPEEADQVLDPARMTERGILGTPEDTSEPGH